MMEVRAKESIITPQIIKEREQRHRRLMRMIKNYKRTNQEIKTLEKIKNNTVMEINLRFLRSEHNRYYKFPKDNEDSDDQEQNLEISNPFTLKQNILYDLRAQNQVQIHKSASNSYQVSQRVKSLQKQKDQYPEQRLGRLKQMKEKQLSSKRLRKGSWAEKKRVYSTIKLPELKRQKLQTQIKTGNDSMEIDKIIGKKLLTEVNSPAKKELVSRYLKKEEERKSRKKLIQSKKII